MFNLQRFAAKKTQAVNSRRFVFGSAAAASLVVVGIAGIGVASSHHTVQLTADGQEIMTSGFHSDVEDILVANEITLGEYDEVIPALDEPLGAVTEIEVLRAYPYHVQTGNEPFSDAQWSTASSLEDVYVEVGDAEQGHALSVSHTHVREVIPLSETAQTVTVVTDGDEQEVSTAGNETVSEILVAAEIEPEPADEVRLRWVEGDPQIDVITEERGFFTETEEIPYETERREDPNRERGTETVTQQGVPGQKTLTGYRQVRGGEITVSAVLSETVDTEPTSRIITVGTKVPEVPVAPSGGDTSAPSTAGMPIDGSVWAALAQCESSGNPTLVYGPYHGLYQFSESTWRSVGGTGLPSQASPAEQTKRAQILQARSGWGQWPACSARLGLR